jgi:hypothetical protein
MMSEINTLMTEATNNTEGSSSTGATEATNPATAQTSAAVADAAAAQQSQQPTEGQPAAAAPQDGTEGNTEGDQGKAGTEPVVPEKYEFKAPEGREFDPGVLEQFSEVAKELKLTQEGAQKVIDKLGTALAEKQTATLENAKAEWVKSATADKEFGGDKLNENLATAKKALETFGTPELRALLNESGLGNHPEIIRAFYRAGKQISEDRFVPGGIGGAGGAKDPAKSLYPNQKT